MLKVGLWMLYSCKHYPKHIYRYLLSAPGSSYIAKHAKPMVMHVSNKPCINSTVLIPQCSTYLDCNHSHRTLDTDHAMHLLCLPVRWTCTWMFSACATLSTPQLVKLLTETLASSVGDLMWWVQRGLAYLLYLGLISTKYLSRSASLQKSAMLPVTKQNVARQKTCRHTQVITECTVVLL